MYGSSLWSEVAVKACYQTLVNSSGMALLTFLTPHAAWVTGAVNGSSGGLGQVPHVPLDQVLAVNRLVGWLVVGFAGFVCLSHPLNMYKQGCAALSPVWCPTAQHSASQLCIQAFTTQPLSFCMYARSGTYQNPVPPECRMMSIIDCSCKCCMRSPLL